MSKLAEGGAVEPDEPVLQGGPAVPVGPAVAAVPEGPEGLDERVDRHMADFDRASRRFAVVLIGSVAALLAAISASLLLGRYPVDPIDAVGIVFNELFGSGHDKTDIPATILLSVRLPRILAALVVGSALAISGAAYQGIFKNPMVAPDILGASAGASVGAALALLFGCTAVVVQGAAFAVGLAAVGLTVAMSKAIGRGNPTVLLLVLCGMVVSTLFQSGVSIIKYIADPNDTLPAITYWLMGSIASVGYDDLGRVLVPYLLGVIPLLALRWKLNVLSFGDEEARALGINISRVRLVSILCSTLLTSSTVAVAGVVGWVGLMIPHLVRFLAGPNYKVVLPLSILIGAVFMLVVDTCCRCVLPYEIPLGILTSIVGGPFFALILFTSKAQVE